MEKPRMDPAERLARARIPEGKLEIVLDTDAYNEVDDQFALAYSLLSPARLHVQAIYAAPFLNSRSQSAGDGMQKSYDEILRLLRLMEGSAGVPALRGSERFLVENGGAYVDSPAARDLVARALSWERENPLYVVALGAITNIASALLMAPEIAQRICVVWLGGHAFHWPDTREFNLYQDIPAARAVLESGCPLILVPCQGVTSHLLAAPAELREALGGRNALCDALVELFCAYTDDPFGWAKELWDVGPIGLLINPAWAPTVTVPCPGISEDGYWTRDFRRHPIRVVYRVNRNAIFRDMYRKLAGQGGI